MSPPALSRASAIASFDISFDAERRDKVFSLTPGGSWKEKTIFGPRISSVSEVIDVQFHGWKENTQWTNDVINDVIFYSSKQ